MQKKSRPRPSVVKARALKAEVASLRSRGYAAHFPAPYAKACQIAGHPVITASNGVLWGPAVVLEIGLPGATVAGSQEIFDEWGIAAFDKTRRVALEADVAICFTCFKTKDVSLRRLLLEARTRCKGDEDFATAVVVIRDLHDDDKLIDFIHAQLKNEDNK